MGLPRRGGRQSANHVHIHIYIYIEYKNVPTQSACAIECIELQ